MSEFFICHGPLLSKWPYNGVESHWSMCQPCRLQKLQTLVPLRGVGWVFSRSSETTKSSKNAKTSPLVVGCFPNRQKLQNFIHFIVVGLGLYQIQNFRAFSVIVNYRKVIILVFPSESWLSLQNFEILFRSSKMIDTKKNLSETAKSLSQSFVECMNA